ncbi:hypothetical protein NADFUDRAFT_83572 [Nadsonia fulvescens var. elongata DSM 6958]|uniref:Uncharacterized protein n=1 Tax=Nadsonia fulvescens var. elongata DSM 6958 TaxID=857566 RepID=A0A1E3PGV6_9ASCO|nr:hypothetical protein NADFUDRAFT_83572 [Nadsonia fulvescens var. elongata DSM 6958]
MDPLMGNLNDTLLRGEVINRSSDRHEVNALKLSMDSMVETNDEVRISSSEYLALYNLVACLKSEISSSRKTVRYYSQLNSLALGKTQKMASLIADNQMPLKPTNRKPTQHPQVNPDVNKSYQAWKSVDLENEKGTFVKHTDFIATEEPISRKMMHRAVSLEGSPENGTQIHIPSSAGEATINASFNREYEREPKKQKINSSHELQLLIISCKARVQRILLLIGAVIVWVIAFAFGIAYLIFKRKLSNFLARIRGGRVSMQ